MSADMVWYVCRHGMVCLQKWYGMCTDMVWYVCRHGMVCVPIKLSVRSNGNDMLLEICALK